jgi:hypothetical protein
VSVAPDEPANVDEIAKRYRLLYYQRLRTEEECILACARGIDAKFALEISKAWKPEYAPQGKIPLNSPFPPVTIHSIPVLEYDFDGRQFIFSNSWGREWGLNGLGFLPFGYLSRYLIEAWTNGSGCHSPAIEPGLTFRRIEGHGDRFGIPRLYEAIDADGDVCAGWLFATLRSRGRIDVEELFVRPEYRLNRIATKLCTSLLHDAEEQPVCFWIPWGDHEDRNAPNLLQWAKSQSLRIEPARVKWAAYRATKGEPVDTLPALDWVPEKATGPIHRLDADDHGYQAAPDILSSGDVVIADKVPEGKKQPRG